MEVSAKSDIGIKAAFTSLVSNIYQQKNEVTLPGMAPAQEAPKSVTLTAASAGEPKEKKKGCCKDWSIYL